MATIATYVQARSQGGFGRCERTALSNKRSTILKKRSTILKERSTILKKRSTILKERSTNLKERSTILKKRSTILNYYKTPLVGLVAIICTFYAQDSISTDLRAGLLTRTH